MNKNSTNQTEKVLFSATDLCTYLNVGLSTAYKLLNTEGFPTVQLRKRKYAKRDLLDKWLEQQSTMKGDI